jgi:hypothetical protein
MAAPRRAAAPARAATGQHRRSMIASRPHDSDATARLTREIRACRCVIGRPGSHENPI